MSITALLAGPGSDLYLPPAEATVCATWGGNQTHPDTQKCVIHGDLPLFGDDFCISQIGVGPAKVERTCVIVN